MATSSISTYLWPGEVYFGFGAAQKTGALAAARGGKHVFIIADPGVVGAGLHEPVLAAIKSAGLAYTLYDHVTPNPDAESIDQAAAAFRECGAQAMVSVGGGSALDTAKAAVLVAGGPPEGRVAEYAYMLGDKKRPDPMRVAPYLAIPTTAGTGAEVTPWAVVTDGSRKFKFGVGGAFLTPAVAVVDPELMMTLPPFLTAATGMDALTHCIEAYVSINDNPVLDPMILYGLTLIARSLRAAVAQGSDRAARRDMAEAALIGGIAISSKWLGACHSLAHQLSGFASVQHGLANAIMLPHQMAFSLPGALERYARVGEALGAEQSGTLRQRAERAVEAVAKLRADVGLPARLSAVGVTEDLIAPMAKSAYTHDLNWTTNPRPVTEKDLEDIYRRAF